MLNVYAFNNMLYKYITICIGKNDGLIVSDSINRGTCYLSHPDEDKLTIAELFKGRSVNRNKRRFSFKTREDDRGAKGYAIYALLQTI